MTKIRIDISNGPEDPIEYVVIKEKRFDCHDKFSKLQKENEQLKIKIEKLKEKLYNLTEGVKLEDE